MDAQHIFPLLKKDASFEAAFDMLSVESANEAVNEALGLLHSAPDPKDEGIVPQEMSQEACLVVSVLQQWLVRHLCKSLMQLMTPEALCLHRKKIPASLIDNYLTNQQHFSLKRLLDYHLGALQSSDRYMIVLHVYDTYMYMYCIVYVYQLFSMYTCIYSTILYS